MPKTSRPPSPPDVRWTLAGEGHSRVEVLRSQFYGYARPAAGEEQLAQLVAWVRQTIPQAHHVAYGFVDLKGTLRRSSDDGEPPGTAGAPCLRALDEEGVTGAAVVVARVFGGRLLGAGRLGRAYHQAAREALLSAGTRTLRPFQPWKWEVPLPQGPILEHKLRRWGLAPKCTYGEHTALFTWTAPAPWPQGLPPGIWVPAGAGPSPAGPQTWA